MEYWKSLGEKNMLPEDRDARLREFKQPVPVSESDFAMSRGTFLKLLGLTFAAAAGGCSPIPVKKAIPYVNKPETVTPGVNAWYASTCQGCSASCGILVKQRDGRPIKIEGNPEHPLSQGGVCAIGQAGVLSLYDADRAQFPTTRGQKTTWADLDQAVAQALATAQKNGQSIRLLSSSIVSPYTQWVVDAFVRRYPNAKQVTYDRNPLHAIIQAHQNHFNQAVLPSFKLEKAAVVLGIDADFLGTWIAPVAFTKAYSAARKPHGKNPSMLQHIQIESRMSLTGSNADTRLLANAREQVQILLWIARCLAQQLSGAPELQTLLSSVIKPAGFDADLDSVVASLLRHRGQALVLCGINDANVQGLVAAINALLGSYGNTIRLDQTSYVFRDAGGDLAALTENMEKGKVGVLILFGVNPCYDAPNAARFTQALRQVPVTVSLSERPDETARQCQHHAPDHHYLEAWGDARPQKGIYSLQQPLMSPLFNTRQAQESLLAWAQDTRSAYDSLKEFWKTVIYPSAASTRPFSKFWAQAVQTGVFVRGDAHGAAAIPAPLDLARPLSSLLRSQASDAGLKLVLYEKVGMRGSSHGNNPWLQELPDPISKAVWDNYACLSVETARALGLQQGQMVELETPSQKIKLPIYIQPGQHNQIVAVALGYGHTAIGKLGNGVGQNASASIRVDRGALRWDDQPVKLTKTPAMAKIACTQEHHFMEGRPIIRESTLDDFKKNPSHTYEHDRKEALTTLWPSHTYDSYRWGMAIDLNACTGCSACVTACQAENNIPSVGKSEVGRNRDMHWIRLDRYYSQDEHHPGVLHQPMLCQHCENAPCETVCPVLATVHSSEGLNQQIYNRCVGTRYCSNNCPYKVRRFNWFNYFSEDQMANLVLNPDVTVRSRGVMEKCSMCVQRIQQGKIDALKHAAKVADGAVKTACQQSCPADAIVFGDINDPHSIVSQAVHDGRAYHVLNELGTRPSVSYLTKLRNRETVNV